MTNDLSTLSGALLEMKDQLIYELGQKGVTASYSSTDGLLGLIGQISQIQTGGGSCYKVTFDNASYTTTTGSVTVSVTVLKNYSACVGETVTFTSSTSTTTTATTTSSGVATATITFSDSTTLTASIGGVSDTASVTVASNIIFSDGGVTGNVNTDYTNVGGTINTSVSATGTNISCSSYSNCARIPNVQLSGDFEITYTLVSRSGDGGGFFILNNNTTTNNFIAYIESNANQGWNIWYSSDQWITVSASLPYDVKITRIGSTFTVYVNDTQINQRAVTSNDIYMGWKTHSAGGRNFTFKDFTITQL